jgi:hypothetical protein
MIYLKHEHFSSDCSIKKKHFSSSHFIESVCDEIWHVEKNTATKFKGDINEFRKFVLKKKKQEKLGTIAE